MARTENSGGRTFIDNASKFLYKPEYNLETANRIKEISEFLSNEPNYNFIIYFNHISLNDPALAFHLAETISPKDKPHYLLVPVSHSHSDTSTTRGKAVNLLSKFVNKFEVETIRVIQSYQVDHIDYDYTPEEAQATHFQYFRRLQELKKAGIPTGVLISPEGHRSETGQLLQAEKGIVATGRILAPIIYVPLGITYAGEYKRNSLNFGKKVMMSVGETYQQKDTNNSPSLEELMKKLAMALPKEMRGIWG